VKKIIIGKELSLEDVFAVAINENIEVAIEEKALVKIKKNRELVDNILKQNKPVYGINTGFGSLSDVKIDNDKLKNLQVNLIRSHSAGVGKPLAPSFVRAMMLLRAHNLSYGFSGVREDVINSILFFLNNNIIPVVPEKGSVGASGDLAPLAHLTLALIGEGDVFYKGKKRISIDVIKELGGKVLELEAKEGLALINGTQFMAALGCIALIEAESLTKHADIITALSIEGMLGTFAPFDIRISEIRPHEGQKKVSKNILKLSKGSEITNSHKNCGRVQDPYSLRCVPQVHGAIRDAVDYLRRTLSVEINSVTDNPLVFDDAIISGGNFHGEPLALAFDFASIALTELSSISERRTDKLLTPSFNAGLPAYLSKKSGVNSGFMIAQYTAAALLNENRVLAHPSSIDNVPTSNDKEDHVSMGATGARKLLSIIDNVETVLAIELMLSVEACTQRLPLKPSQELGKVIDIVRKVIAALGDDRVIAKDIEEAKNIIKSKTILAEVSVD
jgi:histidine ammonia-lyase